MCIRDSAKEKFKKEIVECGDIVIIGFPFDEGCARNGGRAGSRRGPEMFEKALKNIGPVHNAELGIDLRGNEKKKNVLSHDRQPAVQITYIGCVSGARHMKRRLRQADGDAEETGPTLEDAHVDLEELVLAVLAQGRFPFIIGGSNDQSASNGRAFLRHHYERELRELRNEHGYKEHHYHRHKHGMHAMAAAAAAAAETADGRLVESEVQDAIGKDMNLSLIHISEPTRLLSISYAVFCLKKKKKTKKKRKITA
eukprot:TRINITY_DN44943_c0_g1_i1.p2 TRINITY_DN44943_c0_g1~~TRINITY_DN44943_c0_g1_i1.p2  ORF type:complete len:254 (-),score=102.31 TRINITY_DN44943_c0_g1_i1:24-785(-)